MINENIRNSLFHSKFWREIIGGTFLAGNFSAGNFWREIILAGKLFGGKILAVKFFGGKILAEIFWREFLVGSSLPWFTVGNAAELLILAGKHPISL